MDDERLKVITINKTSLKEELRKEAIDFIEEALNLFKKNEDSLTLKSVAIVCNYVEDDLYSLTSHNYDPATLYLTLEKLQQSILEEDVEFE